MVRIVEFLRRLPWWTVMALGLLSVALGLTLLAKPFDSLSALVLIVAASFIVTGVSEGVNAWTPPMSRLGLAVGAGWVLAGMIAVAWPGLTIRGLAIYAGVSLIGGGLARVLAGFRGTADDRLISTLSGLTSVIFGVLALSWPDVTNLIIALLVGPRMILFGLGQIAAGFARRPTRGEESAIAAPDRRRSRWPRWSRVLGATASLALALGLLAVSAWLHDGGREVDAFYDAPEDVASTPGVLLRGEPFTRDMPDGAQAWRILYTTTRDDETPAVASAIVLVSNQRPEGPRGRSSPGRTVRPG